MYKKPNLTNNNYIRRVIIIKMVKGMVTFGAGVASGLLYQKYNKDICNMINSLKDKQNSQNMIK